MEAEPQQESELPAVPAAEEATGATNEALPEVTQPPTEGAGDLGRDPKQNAKLTGPRPGATLLGPERRKVARAVDQAEDVYIRSLDLVNQAVASDDQLTDRRLLQLGNHAPSPSHLLKRSSMVADAPHERWRIAWESSAM